jgi:XTP/dITP diphosphohydrolase
MRIYIATGNAGKLRDFAGMQPELVVELLPRFRELDEVVEDGLTFEANARKKAEYYSRFAPSETAAEAAKNPGDLVMADDSGIEVDALEGAPGVHSARFAGRHGDDEANNALLLQKLRGLPFERRTARFVCVLAVARRGVTLATFRGTAEGYVMDAPRAAPGKNWGFGYDPLFFSPDAGCGFAEIPPERKALYSHRGKAARALLDWVRKRPAIVAPDES